MIKEGMGDDFAGDETSVTPISAAQIAAAENRSILFRRWLGVWIDTFALLMFLVVLELVLGGSLYRRGLPLWVAILVLYFPVTERLWGKSLGKWITGLRVIDGHGGHPAWWQVFVRFVLRVFEVNPFLLGGLPAGLVAAFSPCKQRLGDMLAKTYVIRDKDHHLLRSAG
jgi:uncharacterized RDD family membrane protein YckC